MEEAIDSLTLSKLGVYFREWLDEQAEKHGLYWAKEGKDDICIDGHGESFPRWLERKLGLVADAPP